MPDAAAEMLKSAVEAISLETGGSIEPYVSHHSLGTSTLPSVKDVPDESVACVQDAARLLASVQNGDYDADITDRESDSDSGDELAAAKPTPLAATDHGSSTTAPNCNSLEPSRLLSAHACHRCFNLEQIANVVRLAELHVAEHGWLTKRHSEHPTTDFSLLDAPSVWAAAEPIVSSPPRDSDPRNCSWGSSNIYCRKSQWNIFPGLR
jgi:hypothetical protein